MRQAAVLNRPLERARSEIIVFAEASSMCRSDTVRRLGWIGTALLTLLVLWGSPQALWQARTG